MKILVCCCVGLFLVSFCFLFFVQVVEIQFIYEFSFDNGLKVIVCEDYCVLVVVFQFWYRIGFSYEIFGFIGLFYVFEYMMFKGSCKFGLGEVLWVLCDLGVEENVFIIDDYIVYYQVLVCDCLLVVLEMEVDCMVYLSLLVDQFKSEIEVIKEECCLCIDDNFNVFVFECFKVVVYLVSGYYILIIGWMVDLQCMIIDDLCYWYEFWYVLNNVILVVVGDVIVDEVKIFVKCYFGEIFWCQLLLVCKLLELVEFGECWFKLYVCIQLLNLIMGFNVFSLGSSENFCEVNVLCLIGVLFDGGYSVCLVLCLECGEELVVGVFIYYDVFNCGDSLFVFLVMLNVQKGKIFEQVEVGLWKQFDDFKQNLFSVVEIECVCVQMIVGMVYEKDFIVVQVSSIGQLESVGLFWKLIDQDLEVFKVVILDDIQKVVCIYFILLCLILV